jgi:hypothetical protein
MQLQLQFKEKKVILQDPGVSKLPSIEPTPLLGRTEPASEKVYSAAASPASGGARVNGRQGRARGRTPSSGCAREQAHRLRWGELLAVSCQQRTVLSPCGSVLQETDVGGREGKRRLDALSRVEVGVGRDEEDGRMGRMGLVSLRG